MLLNFMTALGQKLRAIEKFPKDRNESHTTESARMNHKSGKRNGMKKEWREKCPKKLL
jgi:hypothetical protein